MALLQPFTQVARCKWSFQEGQLGRGALSIAASRHGLWSCSPFLRLKPRRHGKSLFHRSTICRTHVVQLSVMIHIGPQKDTYESYFRKKSQIGPSPFPHSHRNRKLLLLHEILEAMEFLPRDRYPSNRRAIWSHDRRQWNFESSNRITGVCADYGSTVTCASNNGTNTIPSRDGFGMP